MSKYRATRRVEFHDTDSAGIMHFSRFFQFMEEAEHELLRSVGLSVFMSAEQAQQDVPLSWPRVSAHCDYRNALRFEDEVNIDVSIEKFGRSSVTWLFEFTRGDTRIAQGTITSVCCRIEPTGPKAISIPDWIRAKLEPFQAVSA